ncbi:hypothetical protein JA1_005390 [Spathaspora sp. JA1]|nr:hypothetical protein JA1_005390 [Spathaspora sp. JA1]
MVESESSLFYTTTFTNVLPTRFDTLINHGFSSFNIFGDLSQVDSSTIYVEGTIHNMNQFHMNGTFYNMTIESLVNSGSIEFRGISSTVRVVDRVQNSGTICLSKVTPKFPNIYGNGCLVIDGDFGFEGKEIESTIVIQDGGKFIARDITKDTTFKIAGFGNNTSLEIGNAREYKSSSYNSQTGIFTIVYSNYNVELDLGLGYVDNKFEITDLVGSIVKYNGLAPSGANSIPQDCSCSPNTAIAPGTEPTLVLSTYTSHDQLITNSILVTKNNDEWTTIELALETITETPENYYTNTTKTILTTETILDAFTTTVIYSNSSSSTTPTLSSSNILITDISKPPAAIPTSFRTTSTLWQYSTISPESNEGENDSRQSPSSKLALPELILFFLSIIFI